MALVIRSLEWKPVELLGTFGEAVVSVLYLNGYMTGAVYYEDDPAEYVDHKRGPLPGMNYRVVWGGRHDAGLGRPNGIKYGGHFGSEADARADVERLTREAAETWFACVQCGHHEKTNQWEPKTQRRLIERQWCFECDHWEQCLARGQSVVIDGKHFQISPDQPAGYKGFVGFGGARFNIEFFDGRKVTTHNLWHQGTVPLHFRDRLPDNARFVKEGK